MTGAVTLTASQLERFARDGYVPVPGFFAPPEVAALQREVAALQAAGKLRNVHTIGDGKTHSRTAMNLQICPIGPANSRLIAALPWRRGLGELLAALVGGDAVQHLDQLFLKPARTGVGTGWHTDNAYFKAADPRYGVGMWIAVHDATVANGTMHVVPRSHLRVWAHVRDGGSDHHITCAAEIDEAAAVPVELPAGGVLFFNYGIAHRTGPNATDRDRAGLALHFVAGAHAPREDHNFRGLPPERWRWLGGPRADGGLAFHGEDLRGEWERLVAATAVAGAASDAGSAAPCA